MTPHQIIRAWKDPEFRAHLSAEERSSLPDIPSGPPLTELDDEALNDIVGGRLVESTLSTKTIGASTGCTGPVRATCGIVVCPIVEAF